MLTLQVSSAITQKSCRPPFRATALFLLRVSTVGIDGIHHRCQDPTRTASGIIMPGQKQFVHRRYACDRSAVKFFSCHFRHSLEIYNVLTRNVFMKNVKNDSKSKINFCCK